MLTIPADLPVSPALSVCESKSGVPTVIETLPGSRERPLHSKYDPVSEAKRAIADFKDDKYTSCVIYSPLLGYECMEAASLCPEKTIVIVEPDLSYLMCALTYADWEAVFNHPGLILLAGADLNTAAGALRTLDLGSCLFIKNANRMEHGKEYFAALDGQIEHIRQVRKVNDNTLQKFSSLWLRNSIKNLKRTVFLDGIEKYQGLAGGIPFTVIAAGPSLEKLKGMLPEIKKRSLIICVNTALHSCLQDGVEPDFIIITDPQNAAFRHIQFYRSPSSVLIAESAVYPKTFDFDCREKVMCSSMFPIGQYFESRIHQRGKLEAGGSVATSAWDFARMTGASELYLAGLDLGFPDRQTHTRGSQFEELSHMTSLRWRTGETVQVNSLLSAPAGLARDYSGKSLLTDVRMELFASWFESSVAKARESGQETFSLTEGSRAIEGVTFKSLDDFLKLPPVEEKRREFFTRAQEASCISCTDPKELNDRFTSVLHEFSGELTAILKLASEGERLCSSSLQDRNLAQKLDAIDRAIMTSSAKDAASLVFPTKEQFEQLSSSIKESDPYGLKKSRLIYSLIKDSAEKILALQKKYC